MAHQKLSPIQWYHARTPLWEMPPWVYGLRSVMMNKRYLSDLHLPWDYGLSADCHLLCRHRRGPLPFSFRPGMWEHLEARRRRCRCSCAE